MRPLLRLGRNQSVSRVDTPIASRGTGPRPPIIWSIIIFLCATGWAQAQTTGYWKLLTPFSTALPHTIQDEPLFSSTVYDSAHHRAIMVVGNESSNDGYYTEVYQWRGGRLEYVAPIGPSPGGREHFALAYDPKRDRTVMFGGYTHHFVSWNPPQPPVFQDIFFNDTWEWDGSRWQQMTPQNSPPTPSTFPWEVMAYDPVRQKLLKFGGADGSTWTWDGTNWERLSPAHSPGANANIIMLTVENTILLFAGEVWEWNGTDWRHLAGWPYQLSTSSGAAYDPVRQRVVFFGGMKWAQPMASNDTWEWDGTTFTLCNPAVKPYKQDKPQLVYDPVGRRTVKLDDTFPWFWDGTQWTHYFPNGIPSLSGSAMIYDSTSHTALLFGGNVATPRDFADSTNGMFDGTLRWQSGIWTDLETTTHPPALRNHAMVFDSVRRRTIYFGTRSTVTPKGETWSWNGSTWTELRPQHEPPASDQNLLAYDSLRDRVVRHSPYWQSTWEFNGTDWIDRTGSVLPPRLYGADMVYDKKRARSLLFGDSTSARYTGDMQFWAWDGLVWTRLVPAHLPTGCGAMAYDEDRQRVVLLASNWENRQEGASFANTLWEWDGTDWSQVPTVFPFPWRMGMGFVYDTAASVFLIAGGGGDSAGVSDTWRLSFRNGVASWNRYP